MTPDAIRKRRARKALPSKLSVRELAFRDVTAAKERKERFSSDKKYKILLERIEELETLVEAVKVIEEVSYHKLGGVASSTGEATAVVLASDWHTEELVEAGTVNDLNHFDLKVSEERMDLFFRNIAKLIRSKQKSVKIRQLILALIGDFISGSIHDELAETNLLPPADALVRVQNKIASGIRFLLQETDVDIVCPCHSGNHARMTKKQRYASERGNSLEYIMYHNLANHFQNEKRVKFIISPGYHSYVDVHGYVIRFHHGHGLRYQGGIGGLYIPTNKAIAQWNKARRADLDCFGHWHQFRDGGNFICNGSLIGYNAFALAIKADYEKPKQAFFLVNLERQEKTDVCPIWLE